ncbi:Gldg family protein [Endozoicomonas sp. SM1973]|uniref:Gldg family protein n=1 Tax=Spartinivicinus marinus TaxID=2994442 RepID=A0A853HX73_9GAMM|nr:Gldg family protein [Spartinivicinus marinus]MCX4029249.1 Gldg family protein [Spartinivicinus marinus]NYZ65843.1 Gldg family protein [Spartinivicinus marinus]
MQPNGQPLPLIRRIAAKEVALFFASPIAYLFLATFVAVTLFIFFWGEAFFSRNIADVRPMFEWMPLLLIFLTSTLTMRLWSEERRTGTLEHVLTQPVPLWHFVVGKFVGCLLLLAIALTITLPLPMSVSLMGDLDWGPVWAGYLATFLLGAAYLSIGLFVSARSDNQIVSLISAVALSGLFYLVGTNTITDFFGNQAGEWLRALGTGSRFDAITRGVIDFRDLYYYLSMIAVFLALNTFVLEKERWATQQVTPHHQAWRAVTGLLLANAIGANLWLGQINSIRLDATEGDQYSISEATTGYLNQLQEPLLVRGYFSSKTHPLLAPLVPQLRDLIEEYEVAGNGKVRVEFVDPVANPELEEEANQKYGIQPVPFQVADRYQASIVSSYFNVLVQYGDEHQVLGFRDLIEVKARSEADIDVQLRNPEHDLTRAIKKVLNSYQAGGNLFDTVKSELVFNGYISNESALPEKLVDFKKTINKVLDKLKADAHGRFTVNFIDPDADGGKVGQQIAQDFGFKPMATSLLSKDRFYFYMTLANQEEQTVQIPLGDMSEGSFERNLEAGIKRFASGFTKTVALVAPQMPGYNPYGMGGGAKFTQLEQFLGDELNIKREDLSDGRVSGDADILLLASPKDLDEKQLFAIDQFLMQGGTVIAATSPYSASLSNRSLSLQKQNSGLQDWLAHHGLSIEDKIVMDPQNAAFPVPVTRNVGGFQFQEMRMLDYPYFIDVRGKGLNQDIAITADLPQTTVAWASPIKIDEEKQDGRKVTELLRSSAGAWLSSSMDIMPKITRDGLSAFTPEGKQGSHLLGIISAGRFSSYFADKESPLLTKDDKAEEATGEEAENAKDDQASEPKQTTVSSVISRSPESARIVLFSSNDFLRDQVIRMAGSSTGSEYLNNLQLLANTVDWSLEDAGLLSIRSRGHFNRTLPPMEHDVQLFWEYLNYGMAIFALGIIAIVQRQRKRARDNRYLALLAN